MDHFTKGFGRYVCDGDQITCEVDSFKVTATVHHDPDMGPPWEEHDGHGPVSDWTTRDKRPGERILSTDRDSHRFYDFAEAVKIARKDGWDAKPYKTGTAGEQAVRAAEADFLFLKAWCDDEWTWCGVAVTVSKNGVDLTGEYDHALWGIECNASDNGHLAEIAEELVGDALDAAKTKLAEIAGNTLVHKLAVYVSPEDAELDHIAFLRTVADRIQDDIADLE